MKMNDSKGEKNNPLISVIAPVYNVEKYLRKCLDSIVNQTYRNLEILLVDDGSTDNSGKICDEFQRSDNRVHVFHRKNGGPSSARNFGIEQATGDYISFIDSDDWLDLEFVEKLLMIAEGNNVDIVGCSTVQEYENGKKQYNHSDRKTGIISGKELILDILYQTRHAYGAVYAKLYKKELIKSIRFPVDIKNLEDYVVSLQLYNKSGCIYFINQPMYHYVVSRNSLSRSSFSLSKLSSLTTAQEFKNYFINSHADNEIIAAANYFIFLMYSSMLYDCYRSNISTKKEVIQKYKKDSWKAFKQYWKTSKKQKRDWKLIVKFLMVSIY